jgi:hypothetical protein
VLALGLVLMATACAEGVEAEPTTNPVSPPTTWYSMAEKAELKVACILERGFRAEVYEGIGVMVHYDGQEEAVERAVAECSDDVDARYPDPPLLSDRESYDAFLEAAECLEAEGVTVSDPPTFETWVESGRTWSPFSDIGLDDDFWALHRKCPQPGLGLTPEGGSEQ